MADPQFKKDKVSQKFNLQEMFGVSFKDAPELRASIGQAIINKIIERTEAGAGIGGRPFSFGKYSDEYSESVEFKAAGKDQHEVNMSLTGDMLGLMDVINETSNTIEIGWLDDTQNAKAFNHNTGDTVPKRPFFGLSRSEVKELVAEFKPEVRDAIKTLKNEGRDEYTEKALRFLDRLEGEDDGE